MKHALSRWTSLALRRPRQCRLRILDQLFNPLRIGFGMTVTAHRVGAARGFDKNLRPNHSRLNVNRSHFAYCDAHFILAEPRSFATRHSFVADLDDRWKEKISLGPAAGSEDFDWHKDLRKFGGSRCFGAVVAWVRALQANRHLRALTGYDSLNLSRTLAQGQAPLRLPSVWVRTFVGASSSLSVFIRVHPWSNAVFKLNYGPDKDLSDLLAYFEQP
jgi:hypothetical protein